MESSFFTGAASEEGSYVSWSSHCGEKFAGFEGLSRRALVLWLECIRVLRPPPVGASISRLYCTAPRRSRRMFGVVCSPRRATRPQPLDREQCRDGGAKVEQFIGQALSTTQV